MQNNGSYVIYISKSYVHLLAMNIYFSYNYLVYSHPRTLQCSIYRTTLLQIQWNLANKVHSTLAGHCEKGDRQPSMTTLSN